MLPTALIGDGLPPLRRGLKRLFLCRHGETDFNARSQIQGKKINAPLNTTGHRQAPRVSRSSKGGSRSTCRSRPC